MFVEVDRSLRAKREGRMPESKAGWLKKQIFDVHRQTVTTETIERVKSEADDPVAGEFQAGFARHEAESCESGVEPEIPHAVGCPLPAFMPDIATSPESYQYDTLDMDFPLDLAWLDDIVPCTDQRTGIFQVLN